MIDLPLDDEDRPYDPPLLDALTVLDGGSAFALSIVPGDDLSEEESLPVRLDADAPEGRRVRALLEAIERHLPSPIRRIVHGGGGDFTLHLADGNTVALSAATHDLPVTEVSDRLKQIADAGEVALREERQRHANPLAAKVA